MKILYRDVLYAQNADATASDLENALDDYKLDYPKFDLTSRLISLLHENGALLNMDIENLTDGVIKIE